MPPIFTSTLCRRLRCAVPAAILAATGLPAWAVATASVRGGPLQVQITDLRPDDSIAPAFTFADIANSSVLAVVAAHGNPNELFERMRFGSWRHDIRLSADIDTSSISGFIGGGGATEPQGLSLSMRAETFRFAGAPGALAGFLGDAELLGPDGALAVTLAPWTQVVMRIDVSADLSTRGDDDTASADFFLNFDRPIQGGESAEFQLACERTCDKQESRSLMLTFANASDTSLNGTFSVGAVIRGTAFAEPVPEPSTWALMMAGVAMILRLGHRRRQRGHSAATA